MRIPASWATYHYPGASACIVGWFAVYRHRPRPKALRRDADNPPAEMLSQAASKRPSIILELRDVAGTDMFLFQEPVTLDAIQRVEDACHALALKRRGQNGGGLSEGTMC